MWRKLSYMAVWILKLIIPLERGKLMLLVSAFIHPYIQGSRVQIDGLKCMWLTMQTEVASTTCLNLLKSAEDPILCAQKTMGTGCHSFPVGGAVVCTLETRQWPKKRRALEDWIWITEGAERYFLLNFHTKKLVYSIKAIAAKLYLAVIVTCIVVEYQLRS